MRTAFTLLAALIATAARADDPRPTPDEKAIRDVVEGLFADYTKKDLNAFMGKFSPKAVDVDTRRQTMARIFSETGPITLKSLIVHAVEVRGDATLARLTVELEGQNKKTGMQHQDLGRMHRVLEFAREDGAWKVRRYGPTHPYLARALVAARDVTARDKLLTEQPELVDATLADELLGLAHAAVDAGRFAEADRIIDVAESVAARTGSKSALAWCWRSRGLRLKAGRKPDEARAAFHKAVHLSREAGDQVSEMKAFHNLGWLESEEGRLEDAAKAFTAALTIAERIDHLLGQAMCWQSFSNLQARAERWDEAIRSGERARSLPAGEGRRRRGPDPLQPGQYPHAPPAVHGISGPVRGGTDPGPAIREPPGGGVRPQQSRGRARRHGSVR